MHHVEIEEEGGGEQGDDEGQYDGLHADVALCAWNSCACCRGFGTLAAKGLLDERETTHDDTATLPDTDDAGHGNTADADALGILEDLLRHGITCKDACTDFEVRPDEGNGRNHNPPDEYRTGTHDGSIFQSHDVSHSEQSSRGVAT